LSEKAAAQYQHSLTIDAKRRRRLGRCAYHEQPAASLKTDCRRRFRVD
jgi:hypothetical protein